MSLKKASRPPAGYKEGLKQNWTRNGYAGTVSDQFGCVIECGHIHYTLHIHEVEITKFYSLAAAKLVSTIILNDKIMCKPSSPD